MTAGDNERLQFLTRVIRKEIKHLEYSSRRVFTEAFSTERARALATDQEQAERVEAYTSRFCRLQDTLGDKLLPAWLQAVGERAGAAIDNLDKAEKLGLMSSSDQWMAIRQTRNQMIHEYMESPEVLADALMAAHQYESEMIRFAHNVMEDLARRQIIELESE